MELGAGGKLEGLGGLPSPISLVIFVMAIHGDESLRYRKTLHGWHVLVGDGVDCCNDIRFLR